MRTLWNGVATLIVVAGTTGLCVSCTFPGSPVPESREIAIAIPGMPEVYAPMRVVWHVVWWNGATVKTEVFQARRATDPLKTTLPLSRRGAEVVVVHATARPVSGGVIAPLGAWGAPPKSELAPEPTLGRAAEAVLRVARRGLDPALINLERLHRTVVEECGDEPERLDQERLVERLGSGDMTRYAIRRRARPGCELSLPVPVDATWISNDITEGTIDGVRVEGRCYWVIPVAKGEVRHLWQWAPDDLATPADPHAPGGPTASAERARLLTVGRNRDGHAFWFISPPR